MFEPLVGFRSEKAAQIAAFFATKENPIEKLKLIKLIYLSEREFVSTYGEPMLYDELFSLPHGPICSSSLNALNGKLDQDIWSRYLKMDGKRNVVGLFEFNRADLIALSDADFGVISSVWETFGFMTSVEIRNYTHKNCPEYTDTSGRVPISYRDILKAEGDEDADEIEDRISTFRRPESLLTA